MSPCGSPFPPHALPGSSHGGRRIHSLGPWAAMPICGPACRCSQGLSCLQALDVLTSSVEYGLQDLCKVRPCLDWGWWSPSAPVLRSTPRWSLCGWWLEVALRMAPWCITQVQCRLSPCFSIPEGISGGIPLEGVQHRLGAAQGLGNPREEHGASRLPHGKGQQESPYAVAHGCSPVVWQDDAVGKAPVLGSAQHPSHGAAKGVLLQAGRSWEGTKKEG